MFILLISNHTVFLVQFGIKVTYYSLMEYKSTTFNSFEKASKLLFPSLFTVCLSLLPFYVKFEQFNVNKWPKSATEHPMRDWALVG